MSREKFEADFKKGGEELKSRLQDGYIEKVTKMDAKRDKLLAQRKKINEKIAEIEGKPEAVTKKERTAEEKEAITKKENFYKKYFPEKAVDLSAMEIPKRTPEEEKELTRLLIRSGSITDEEMFQKCKELFPSDKHTSSKLDEIVKDVVIRPKGAYAIWVRDTEAADEKHKNKSANMVEKEKLNTETLGERLEHELEYFDETGDHLDKNTGTICTGSRHSDGDVPRVYWHDGRMHVGRSYPDYRFDFWSPRQAVSSAEGGK